MLFLAVMQTGFAFLEAGSVRSKNTTNILIKNFLDVCKYNRLIVFCFQVITHIPLHGLSPVYSNCSLAENDGYSSKNSAFPRLGYGVLLIYSFDSYFNYFFQLLVRWLIGYLGSPLLLELKATNSLDTSILLWLTYLPTSTPSGFFTSFSRQLRQQLSAVPWPRELSSKLICSTLCFWLVSFKDLQNVSYLALRAGLAFRTLYYRFLFVFIKGALSWYFDHVPDYLHIKGNLKIVVC